MHITKSKSKKLHKNNCYNIFLNKSYIIEALVFLKDLKIDIDITVISN